jgi:hypothetical protein
MSEDTSTRPPTTTDAGIPVASQEHSLTIGSDGPILLQDLYLIEQMANFNRERIPERQRHAKGGERSEPSLSLTMSVPTRRRRFSSRVWRSKDLWFMSGLRAIGDGRSARHHPQGRSQARR